MPRCLESLVEGWKHDSMKCLRIGAYGCVRGLRSGEASVKGGDCSNWCLFLLGGENFLLGCIGGWNRFHKSSR
jgi:hypothetical protein